MEQKPKKIKSAYALKRGTNATIFTAVFIALVILVNILVSVLANRFPLTLDLNSDLKRSLSDANTDYLKSIDRDVDIYVIGTEKEYSSMINYYASNQFYVNDTYGYYQQTLALIQEYPKYNSHINLVFLDINGKDFEQIRTNYSGYSYGDFFVECKNGDSTRRKLVTFADIYSVDANYETYSYEITGSNLETAMASALYTVTLDKTVRLGIPTEYCGNRDYFLQYFSDTLTSNNYELVDIKGLNVKEIDPTLDGVLVFDPKLDFTSEMITALDAFLDNNGKKGKTFYYFPSDSTVDRPNLNEFLEEWGIAYLNDGNDYQVFYAEGETQYPETLISESDGSVYTEQTDATSKYIFSDYTLAMERTYETYGNKTATVVLKNADGYVLRPAGAGDNWKPGSDATTASYASVIATEDTTNDQSSSSFAVAFGSSDYISSSYNDGTYTGYIKNLDVVLEVFNKTSGQVSAPFSFSRKEISMTKFVTDISVYVMILLFIVIPVVAIVAVCVIVLIRRKNR